jgi:hypothetical protein
MSRKRKEQPVRNESEMYEVEQILDKVPSTTCSDSLSTGSCTSSAGRAIPIRVTTLGNPSNTSLKWKTSSRSSTRTATSASLARGTSLSRRTPMAPAGSSPKKAKNRSQSHRQEDTVADASCPVKRRARPTASRHLAIRMRMKMKMKTRKL